MSSPTGLTGRTTTADDTGTGTGTATEPPGRRSGVRPLIAVLLLIPLLAGAVLWAFAWPAARTTPNDLPVGVAGPPAATAPVQQALDARGGAFEVHEYADAAAARAAIEERQVYGAVVVGGPEPELLTASAASPAVAQMLIQLGEHLVPEGASLTVTDVVPAPAEDPRGGAFGAGVLPLVLAGMMTGAALGAIGLRGGRLAAGLAAAATLVGTVSAALAHSWLGVLDGTWVTVAGALTLLVMAVAATVAGAVALLGPRGMGIAALVVVLMGNPFSGASSAPEMLPDPVGLIGQWLPPGAGASMLRSVAFFDGNGAGFPVLVLTLWIAAGLTAVFLGKRGMVRRAA
jgi:hypothetical protein